MPSKVHERFVTPVWHGGRWFHIYPTATHWTLVDSQCAAEIATKLCPKDKGPREALRKAQKWLEEHVPNDV